MSWGQSFTGKKDEVRQKVKDYHLDSSDQAEKLGHVTQAITSAIAYIDTLAGEPDAQLSVWIGGHVDSPSRYQIGFRCDRSVAPSS